jgi:uncharacterized protein YjbI with pentapeptide repeats
MSQSRFLNYDFGSVNVKSRINISGARLSELGDPIENSDAATKNYVDRSINSGALSSIYYAGTGLTLTTGNIFSVNASQTQINAVGTINTGAWNGSVITVPYGGTGAFSLPSNKLLVGNGSSPISGTSKLTYDGSSFTIDVPVSITDTSNTSLSVAGGLQVAKDTHMTGNLTANDVSVGNLTMTGSLSLNGINASNAVFINNTSTNIMSSNIVSSISIVTANVSTSNLLATNITTTNVLSTNGTISNMRVTLQTAGGIAVTGLAIFSSANVTSLSSGNVNMRNLTVGNVLSVSLTTANLNATGITTASINTTALATTNLTTTNLLSTNITSSALLTTNVTTTNVIATNITSANISSTTVTASNLKSSNASCTNLTSSSLLATNITTSNISTTNLVISNASASSMVVNSLTAANLQISGILNVDMTSLTVSNAKLTFITASSMLITDINVSNVSCGNATITNLISSSLTTGNAKVSGDATVSGNATISGNTSISGDTNILGNTNITGGTNILGDTSIKGDISITGDSIISGGNIILGDLFARSIGTTGFSSNNLLANTVSIGSLVSNNISAGNLTAGSLLVSGTFTASTANSLIVSTGNLYVANRMVGVYLNSFNQTVTNSLMTNMSASSVYTTMASIGSLYITAMSQSNTILTNSTVLNTVLTYSSMANVTITNGMISKSLVISSNYSGVPSDSSGSFLTIAPSTFTNSNSVSGSTVSFWSGNYISSPTLTAQNTNITTNKVSNLFIEGVNVGANQTAVYNANLALAYNSNVTGGTINYQVALERADGSWYSGMYVESTTNRLNIINASNLGNGGVGILSVNPITFDSITGNTNVTPVTYAKFSNTTTSIYSTKMSTGPTVGSLVVYGGLGVNNICTNSISVKYQYLGGLIEGGGTTVSNMYSAVVLNAASTIANYTLTMPVGYDGQIITVSALKSITNMTLGNTSILNTTLAKNASLRFMYIESLNLWVTA